MHYYVWLALAGAFLVLEILTMSLIFLSFCFAALVGAVCAAASPTSSLQWIAFAIAAVLSLVVIRPFVRKYLFRKSSNEGTGVDALISRHATALTDVNVDSGSIRLQNETWTARAESGLIPAGTEVSVKRIDGAVAIVVPKIMTKNA